MEPLWCALAALFICLICFVVSPTARGSLGSVALLAAALSLVPSFVGACSVRSGFGLREVVVAVLMGVGVGLPVAVLLEGVSIPGRLLDTIRGSQHAELMLPHLESRASSLEQVLTLVTLSIGFSSGAVTQLVTLVHDRFVLLCGNRMSDGWSMPVEAFSASLAAALLRLSPALVVFAAFEFVCALLARVESRGGIWNELPGVKLLLGLLFAAVLLGQFDGR